MTDCSSGSIDSADLDKFAIGAALGGPSAPSHGLRQALLMRLNESNEKASISSRKVERGTDYTTNARRGYILLIGFAIFYPVVLFLALLLPNTWDKFTK